MLNHLITYFRITFDQPLIAICVLGRLQRLKLLKTLFPDGRQIGAVIECHLVFARLLYLVGLFRRVSKHQAVQQMWKLALTVQADLVAILAVAIHDAEHPQLWHTQ